MDPLTVFMASLFGSMISAALRTERSFADFYPKSASGELQPNLGWIPLRDRGVRWLVEPGSAVWIESRYLRPMSGNIFDEDKLGAVAKAVQQARRSGEPVPMYAGYGQVHRLTAEWIAESLAYDNSGDGPPFTTGDRDLDEWLVRRYNRENSDPEENEEMEVHLAAAEAAGQGDLGKWTASVRDGNHRTFGAVLGGEERVAIRLYDNDEQDLRELAATRFVSPDGRRQAWMDERRDLLLKAVKDTGRRPHWLDEETLKALLHAQGLDENKAARTRGEKLLPYGVPHLELVDGKTYVTVEGLGRVLEVRQGLLIPVGKGKDESLFPDDGGDRFRNLHRRAVEEAVEDVERRSFPSSTKPDLEDFEVLLVDAGVQPPRKTASRINAKDVDKLIASAEQKGVAELAVSWLLKKGVPPKTVFLAAFVLRYRFLFYPTVIDLLPENWRRAVDEAAWTGADRDSDLLLQIFRKYGIDVPNVK